MIASVKTAYYRHQAGLAAILVTSALLCSGCGTVQIFEPNRDESTAVEATGAAAEVRLVQVQISGRSGSPGWQEFTVYESGQAIVRGHREYAEKRTQLPMQEVQQLNALFRQNDFLGLPGLLYDKNNAAAATYNIFYNSGQDSNTVNTNNAQMNPGLSQVVSTLSVLADRVLFDGLKLELVLDRTVLRQGESLTAQLLVSNLKNETMAFYFSASQLYRFTIRFPGSLVSEGSSAGSASRAVGQERPAAISSGIIRPGEVQRYSLLWDGRDDQGRFVAGTALIQAEWLASPGGITAAKTVILEE